MRNLFTPNIPFVYLLFGQRPSVLPAQGNALGKGNDMHALSGPTGQQFQANCWPVGPIRILYLPVPQGVALGWENGRPFGAYLTRVRKQLGNHFFQRRVFHAYVEDRLGG